MYSLDNCNHIPLVSVDLIEYMEKLRSRFAVSL